MNKRKQYRLLYFDGFAGSGFIHKNLKTDIDVTIGAAKRIVELNDPRPFDIYYFVEKDRKNFVLLQENTGGDAFKEKNIHVILNDCNKKLLDLANFLRQPQNYNVRTLAYIDPCGMQVEWRSVECLRGLPVDMWVLVPTGMGVNRLLKKNGQISDAWLRRLEKFLGLEREVILNHFYSKSATLFPELVHVQKESNAVQKSAMLYTNRLSEVFTFVSKPLELKNSSNSVMYHLFLASNNKAALKIGNDIVKKYRQS